MTWYVERRKLLYGVGVNDADYPVQKMRKVDGKTVRDWTCPYYQRWYDILRRCYNKKTLIKHPTYAGVTICEDWKVFSKFRDWMCQQEWEGQFLDKDLKVRGNRVYSPETCMFISNQVNTFIREGQKSKNNLKVGVSWHLRDQVFTAQCYDTINKKLKHLGYHKDEISAHKAYIDYKEGLIPKMYEAGIVDRELQSLLFDWYKGMRSDIDVNKT